MRLITRLCIASTIAIAAGCGSDDSDDNNDSNIFTPPKDDIIVDGSGVNIVTGPIEDFGSIIINGRRYTTDIADFTSKGENTTQNALARGDYISLYYTQSADGDSLMATQVIYEPPLLGAISAIDTESQTITVLEQTISFTPETLTGDNGDTAFIEFYGEGEFVEISGFAKGNSQVSATRISDNVEKITAISGIVRITPEDTPTIRGVAIDTSGLETNTAFENGNALSVTGEFNSANNTLAATSYRLLAEGPELAENSVLTVDDFIRSFVEETVIMIGDVRPRITEETQVLGGTREDIQDQARVVITYKDTNEAHPEIITLTIKSRAPETINGQIENLSLMAIDALGRQTGTIVVNGQLIRVLGSTVSTLDIDNMMIPDYPLADFEVGDEVIVTVQYDSNNEAYATRAYIIRATAG